MKSKDKEIDVLKTIIENKERDIQELIIKYRKEVNDIYNKLGIEKDPYINSLYCVRYMIMLNVIDDLEDLNE